MTNYEFYKEELGKLLVEHGCLSFAVFDDKIEWCGHCSGGCLFYASDRNCSDLRREWLNAEYVETINAESLAQHFIDMCFNQHCSKCKYGGAQCKFEWLLDNYNITPKEGENNEKS